MSRTVLLTGASGGLGTASTTDLTRRGWNVIAAVRSMDDEFAPLRDAIAHHPGDVQPLLLDLLDDPSIDDAAAQLAAIPLDAIVHNAGVGAFATFEDTPVDAWQAILGPRQPLPPRLRPTRALPRAHDLDRQVTRAVRNRACRHPRSQEPTDPAARRS